MLAKGIRWRQIGCVVADRSSFNRLRMSGLPAEDERTAETTVNKRMALVCGRLCLFEWPPVRVVAHRQAPEQFGLRVDRETHGFDGRDTD